MYAPWSCLAQWLMSPTSTWKWQHQSHKVCKKFTCFSLLLLMSVSCLLSIKYYVLMTDWDCRIVCTTWPWAKYFSVWPNLTQLSVNYKHYFYLVTQFPSIKKGQNILLNFINVACAFEQGGMDCLACLRQPVSPHNEPFPIDFTRVCEHCRMGHIIVWCWPWQHTLFKDKTLGQNKPLPSQLRSSKVPLVCNTPRHNHKY